MGVVGWETVDKFEENNDCSHYLHSLLVFLRTSEAEFFFNIILEMKLYRQKWDAPNSVITRYIRFYVAKARLKPDLLTLSLMFFPLPVLRSILTVSAWFIAYCSKGRLGILQSLSWESITRIIFTQQDLFPKPLGISYICSDRKSTITVFYHIFMTKMKVYFVLFLYWLGIQ